MFTKYLVIHKRNLTACDHFICRILQKYRDSDEIRETFDGMISQQLLRWHAWPYILQNHPIYAHHQSHHDHEKANPPF